MSKDRDITDVDDCTYKIEALLKEYKCSFHIDKELGGRLILFDNDTKQFEFLACTTDYKQPHNEG